MEQWEAHLASSDPGVQLALLDQVRRAAKASGALDMSRSREGHVFIASVNLSTEGSYRCEASAEAPSFQTVVGEKEIKVFVIPEQPPKIRGTRAKYEVGERLDVSCRAPYSLPAAKLLWYINDHKVPFSDVHELETLYDSEGLQSSAVLLSFVLQPYHMIGSSLRLKCVSVISETFLTSSEELIVGDTVPFLPYPETSPHSPRIDGGLPKYRVNDLVNLTCRSAEYDRPPELRWFINDKEARPEYLVRYELHGHPKYAASLGLQFRVRPEHFEDERMHLRCTVTLSNVLNTSSVEANIKNKHRTMSGFRAASKHGERDLFASSLFSPCRREPALRVERATGNRWPSHSSRLDTKTRRKARKE
ncbi:hypothetical protein HPB51_013206 [Rhipicephalus microplus]|uniref:Ig-like domain-containing protein n=1 Tax=Rhipicephalus microplus TaxID=6941 RepID=A0A9J6DN83_RHIMP|nr:hypothetical protein HPB51_013206 [Rhipicephalus microplus]